MKATVISASMLGTCPANAGQSRRMTSAAPKAGHRLPSAVPLNNRPAARASAPSIPRPASARWHPATTTATLAGRINGLPHRFIAMYSTTP